MIRHASKELGMLLQKIGDGASKLITIFFR
jgi:hypothetical protein